MRRASGKSQKPSADRESPVRLAFKAVHSPFPSTLNISFIRKRPQLPAARERSSHKGTMAPRGGGGDGGEIYERKKGPLKRTNVEALWRRLHIRPHRIFVPWCLGVRNWGEMFTQRHHGTKGE